jgi:serine phosphatase RsbU (regulator of sigma subunit)
VPGKVTPPGANPPRATPKRAVLRTPQAGAPAAGDEPIVESEAEIIEADEQPPPVQSPSGSKLRSPGGSGIRKTSGTMTSASSSKNTEGEEPRRKPAKGGQGDGKMVHGGSSLSTKFTVFTFLIIVLVTGLFGFMSIRSLKNSMINEIQHSGQSNILALRYFADKVNDNFIKGTTNDTDLGTKIDAYMKDSSFQEDQAYIKRLADGDKRIRDIALLASSSPVKEPNVKVLQMAKVETFKKGEEVNLPDGHIDVKINWGTYGSEPALFFSMPIQKGSAPGTQFASLSLILSAAEIDRQVNAMILQLVIFGILFIAAGVGCAMTLTSMMTRPIGVLVSDIGAVAKGDLDHESTVPNMTHDEIGALAREFNRMTRSLREAREKEADAQRLAGELNTAKAIHAKLIPEKLPNLPGIDISTAYHCAKEVGGDYYDFIPVGDAESLAFCVADVSGKGITGSMVMGFTRTYLRMMAVGNFSAADVLSKTNSYVYRDIKRGMFVTCVYAILNLRTREMTVASAGHNPMLIWRAATKSIEKVRPNGIALGFDKGPIFNRTVREQKVKLNPGDRVVMYTDGVVESMNERREEWTDEALDAFTLQHATAPSKDYVRLLIKALMDHQGNAEQHDDITVMTFRVS